MVRAINRKEHLGQGWSLYRYPWSWWIKARERSSLCEMDTVWNEARRIWWNCTVEDKEILKTSGFTAVMLSSLRCERAQMWTVKFRRKYFVWFLVELLHIWKRIQYSSTAWSVNQVPRTSAWSLSTISLFTKYNHSWEGAIHQQDCLTWTEAWKAFLIFTDLCQNIFWNTPKCKLL